MALAVGTFFEERICVMIVYFAGSGRHAEEMEEFVSVVHTNTVGVLFTMKPFNKSRMDRFKEGACRLHKKEVLSSYDVDKLKKKGKKNGQKN
jgi:hypothetical protein